LAENNTLKVLVAETVKATMPVTVRGSNPAVYCASPAVCRASTAVWGETPVSVGTATAARP
jgi:hypothetical protein